MDQVRRGSLAAVLAALVALALTACNPPTALEGRLTKPGGAPVANFPVGVFSDDAETLVAEVFTDVDGTYRVTRSELPAGTYRLRFGTAQWRGGTDWSTATPVTWSAGSPAVVDAELAVTTMPLRVGKGNLFSPTPHAGATVEAYALGASGAKPAGSIAVGTSGADGRVTLTDIPAGTYRLRVTDPNHATAWYGNGFMGKGTWAGASTLEATIPPAAVGVMLFLAVPVSVSATIHQVVSGQEEPQPLADALVGIVEDGELVRHTRSGPDGQVVFEHLFRSPTMVELVAVTPDLQQQSSVSFALPTTGHIEVGDIVFAGTDCDPANFHQGASLVDVNLSHCSLPGADLRDATLQGVVLHHADLTGADLTGASLVDVEVQGSSMVDVDLTDAHLVNARLHDTNIEGAVLGTVSADGMNGQALQGTPTSLPPQVNLIQGNWIGPSAHIHDVVIDGYTGPMNVSNAYVGHSTFRNSTIRGANLAQSALHFSTFENTDLTGSTFSYADLAGARFINADLTDVDFSTFYFGGPLPLATDSIFSNTTCPNHEVVSAPQTCSGRGFQ